MSSPTKVLFLGIDAGDKHLIQDWAADGTLRTFRSLLAEGLVGNTMSLEGFFEGSTWPSFYTAVTPAHHGFHRLIQLKPGTYEFHRCYTGDFITREPFWNYLSRAGRRVAILDIPLSGISRRINGIQIVEWGSHDPNYGFCTWPPRLKRDVFTRFGLHPLQKSCDSFARTAEDFCVFKDLLLQGVQRKTALTRHYLTEGRWDFFAQVFTESHCVGHQCWHLHDPSHPSYDSNMVAKTGDPIRDIYVAIDTAIGEILEQLSKDTIVVLLASHRMSYNFGAQLLLPEILIRLKVAQARRGGGLPRKPPSAIGRLDGILSWGWHRAPKTIKEKLKPLRNRVRTYMDGGHLTLPTSVSGIDLKASKCFPLDNGFSVGGIRLNIVGREPNGLINPGKEMDDFCDQLIRDLLDIADCDTGRPMIKSIRRTAEFYQGECLDHLPDLLVEWNDEKPVGSKGTGNSTGSGLRITSGKLGVVEGVNTYCRTGDHRPEGLFIAFGGEIKAGRMKRTVSIMDLAPTIARLLGVELSGTDGKPIAEIFQHGN